MAARIADFCMLGTVGGLYRFWKIWLSAQNLWTRWYEKNWLRRWIHGVGGCPESERFCRPIYLMRTKLTYWRVQWNFLAISLGRIPCSRRLQIFLVFGSIPFGWRRKYGLFTAARETKKRRFWLRTAHKVFIEEVSVRTVDRIFASCAGCGVKISIASNFGSAAAFWTR